MKKLLLLTLSITLLSMVVFSQNVGIGTNTPDSSALLELNSNSKGFLPPRMTCAQRNAIVSPAAGLIVYCTDCASGEMQYYNGANWMNMAFGIGSNTTANLPSVTIGAQVWTTKNLDVAKYRNGDSIHQVTDATQWANLTTGAWCWYNNDSSTYAAKYGRLYNWYAVNDPRGLAPQGWHVPSDAEWNKLVKYIDPSADTTCQGCAQSATAGGAMKETGTSHWLSPNTGATNSSGFAGLPGGYRNVNGSFFNFGNSVGYWWSSSEFNASNAWSHDLGYNFSYVGRNSLNKSYGFSVRCLRD